MSLRAAIGLVAILAAGCASQPTVEPAPRLRERIVLLPSDTERPSAVVVRAHDAELLLDTPYAAADLRGATLETNALTAEAVRERYGALLSAQPPQPRPFTMYFELGSDELTSTSKVAFENARSSIASWSAVEVVVIGHTDRLGAIEYNDQLSKRRAQVIATRLVASGVPSHAIEIAARGEREPLIPTADGIPEPRNRRVEIKVR
jgi:outer membrane protein OmpA-like peptidoglycan-associated protein